MYFLFFNIAATITLEVSFSNVIWFCSCIYLTYWFTNCMYTWIEKEPKTLLFYMKVTLLFSPIIIVYIHCDHRNFCRIYIFNHSISWWQSEVHFSKMTIDFTPIRDTFFQKKNYLDLMSPSSCFISQMSFMCIYPNRHSKHSFSKRKKCRAYVPYSFPLRWHETRWDEIYY